MAADRGRLEANHEFIGWLKQARILAGSPPAAWIERNSSPRIPSSTIDDWTSSTGRRKRLPNWADLVEPVLVALRRYAEEQGRSPDRVLGTLEQWKRAYDDTQVRGRATCPLPNPDSGRKYVSRPVSERDPGDGLMVHADARLAAGSLEPASQYRAGSVGLTPGSSHGLAYLEQVRRIAPPDPPGLVGREAELAELARFCVEPKAERYVWW